MKAYDLSELAVRNLRESLLRNSLTTLGISVGVASLVAMLALGIGLQQLASRRLAKSGLFDTVIVSSRRDIRGFERDPERNTVNPAESPTLDEPARQTIAKLPHVAEAFPDIRFVTELRYEDKPHLTLVAGLPFSAKENEAVEGLQGQFFSSESAAEAILQKTFAEDLLGKRPRPREEDNNNVGDLARLLVGKELTMRYAQRSSPVEEGSATKQEVAGAAYSVVSRTQTLKIVGVSDLDPDSMRGIASARVLIPLRLAQDLRVLQPTAAREAIDASSAPTYSRLTVRVSSPSQVQTVEEAIKKLGYNTFSIVDATRGLRRFFAVLDLFLGIFGSLALAVASIGIVNTLVMAILERRREIGIMKAIGASDADVKRLFFAEAGVMGLFGGVAGVMLGWAIGRVINLGANIYLKRQNFPPEQIWSVPWWLVAGAIAFAIAVSLVSGLYPAGRAARLDPVQALRYE